MNIAETILESGYEFVVLLLFSGVFFVLYGLLNHIDKDDPYKDALEADGVISKVTDSDSGSKRFYVRFNINPTQEVEAQSIYYFKTHNKYHKGDSLRIKYIKSSSMMYRCKLIDSELEPCSTSGASKVCLGISIAFLVASVLFLILFQ